MKNLIRLAAMAALLLTSGPALAQSRASHSSSGLTNMGVLVGFEDGDGDTGFALRGDAEFLPTRLAPNANVSLVLSLGFTRFSDSVSYVDVKNEWSWNIFKVIPAARFSFDLAPRFGLYGDAGLGLYVGSWSHTYTDRWNGISEKNSDSDVGLQMRLAAGAKFLVTPTFDLGAELGVNPYFGGDYDDTTLSAMMLASFRM